MFPSILDSEWLTFGMTMLGALIAFLSWRHLMRPRLKRFEGYLLGRIKDEPDNRDLWRLPALVGDKQPERVDLRPRLPAAWNQGRQGSCVGHGGAAAVEMKRRERDFNHKHRVSPRFAYWIARFFSGSQKRDTGTSVRAVVKGFNQYGYCLESSCPYNDRDATTPPSKQSFELAANRKIKAYRRVPQTIEALCGAIAEGDPVIFGFDVRDNFKPDREGVIPMPKGEVSGGHCMLLVGYDKTTRRFLARNSWGTSWGKNGHCELHFAHVLNPQEMSDFWTIDEVPA